MQYRQLGKTELQVSAICLGTMTFGEQNTEARPGTVKTFDSARLRCPFGVLSFLGGEKRLILTT